MATITTAEMAQRIVRYDDLIPCRTAFIDAHTPQSDQKENFTIIGAGVSESPDQHVHLSIPHGFNIGAAGQPPRCRNSLHSHRTAEVFFILSGRWRFFWGRSGDAGEVVLEEGDIFNIPTGMFRGFENIGTDYGMLMAILGGDDAGGGVAWAPEVLDDAKAHGLVLGENGQLYDTKQGQQLPSGVAPMPKLDDEALRGLVELNAHEIVPRFVARYSDLVAMAKNGWCNVIGAEGVLYDRPGFEVNFMTQSVGSDEKKVYDKPSVLMPVHGDWLVRWDGGEVTLGHGDTMSVPAQLVHACAPRINGEAALYQVVGTDDPAGATWRE